VTETGVKPENKAEAKTEANDFIQVWIHNLPDSMQKVVKGIGATIFCHGESSSTLAGSLERHRRRFFVI
jgi:hypothetical protein